MNRHDIIPCAPALALPATPTVARPDLVVLLSRYREAVATWRAARIANYAARQRNDEAHDGGRLTFDQYSREVNRLNEQEQGQVDPLDQAVSDAARALDAAIAPAVAAIVDGVLYIGLEEHLMPEVLDRYGLPGWRLEDPLPSMVVESGQIIWG